MMRSLDLNDDLIIQLSIDDEHILIQTVQWHASKLITCTYRERRVLQIYSKNPYNFGLIVVQMNFGSYGFSAPQMDIGSYGLST